MNPYEAAFSAIAEDVEVLNDSAFHHREWGELRPAPGVESAPGDLPVLPHLSRFLYLSYYAGDARAARWLIDGAPVVLGTRRREDPAVARALAEANQGSGYWDNDWQTITAGPEGRRVRKNGLTLTVTKSETLPPAATAGQRVSVRFPPDRPYMYPGWYLAISDEGMPRHGERPVIRLYYTPRSPAAAADLMRAITGRLCAARVPYQLKAANHPEGYGRRDAMVLYLYRNDWRLQKRELADVHREHVDALRDTGPALALELGKGWWMADEPEQRQGRLMSFGQHRCLLVAEGLVAAWRDGHTTAADRLRAIKERYRAERLDPAKPYLNSQEGAAR
ncbi:T3SS effector HopA1 family protein [Streptomyces sp. NPDC050315]|uniref:T3SS effector HopA1 family protein n=1 Tax=Streptomyces sp. NPDC050315 TaxID=3155039 RepID=UPI00341ADC82